MKILDEIYSPEDIKALSTCDLELLSEELRQFLIENVSKTGGHLSSNLGIVELTLAIHRVFNTDKDRLVFDVGHQSYIHKILTGRKKDFDALRTLGGVSGFPKPAESIYDAFIGGHASNSVSVALGMARARSMRHKGYSVIALLGDGALTGGLAYEGLNDAGQSGEPLIIILNDNGMSINANVGGMAKYLSRQRLKPNYFKAKKAFYKLTELMPGGRTFYKLSRGIKQRVKRFFLGSTMFEDMGFTYLGPVDGHDIEKLCYILQYARELKCPVIVHTTTTKGKGYKYSEADPVDYHGISKFDIDSGEFASHEKLTFSKVFGGLLCQIADEDERVCAITAAMEQGTGLEPFKKLFPKRFFDVGIAEGHAVSMAAGLARQGAIPVFAVYSTFLQRSYDMLIHDLAILGEHVVLAVDRCGLVGEDGETHHGMFDVGFLRQVPGMKLFCPSNYKELRSMLNLAIYECRGPVAIRYPRGCEGGFQENYFHTQAAVIRKGSDVTIIAYGILINAALEAADVLSSQGKSAEVIKLSTLTCLDYKSIIDSVEKTRRLVIVDDSVKTASVGQEIGAELSARGVALSDLALINLGEDFIPHGDTAALYKRAGISAEGIAKRAMEVLSNEEAAH